jgi:hypothetical protein
VKGLAGLGAVRASGIKHFSISRFLDFSISRFLDFSQMCERVALPIRTSSGV